MGLEREIKQIDREIKKARRAATTALTLVEKLTDQREIKAREALHIQKRRSLSDAQDQVEKQCGELIELIEGKHTQTIKAALRFVMRWTIA